MRMAGTISCDMQYPTGALPRMNISLTDAERDRLEALARRLGVKPSRAIAMAVAHTLVTVRRNQRLHTEELGEREGEARP